MHLCTSLFLHVQSIKIIAIFSVSTNKQKDYHHLWLPGQHQLVREILLLLWETTRCCMIHCKCRALHLDNTIFPCRPKNWGQYHEVVKEGSFLSKSNYRDLDKRWTWDWNRDVQSHRHTFCPQSPGQCNHDNICHLAQSLLFLSWSIFQIHLWIWYFEDSHHLWQKLLYHSIWLL